MSRFFWNFGHDEQGEPFADYEYGGQPLYALTNIVSQLAKDLNKLLSDSLSERDALEVREAFARSFCATVYPPFAAQKTFIPISELCSRPDWPWKKHQSQIRIRAWEKENKIRTIAGKNGAKLVHVGDAIRNIGGV